MSTTTNLGIELINGSDYISPDPINNGFTTLDKLGVDYVTEQGTFGEWWYRKWKSGYGECWMARTISDASMSDTWGSLYYYSIGSTAFPYSFSSKPHMTITYSATTNNSAFAVPNVGLSTSATGTIMLCNPQSGKTATGVLSIYISGLYK